MWGDWERRKCLKKWLNYDDDDVTLKTTEVTKDLEKWFVNDEINSKNFESITKKIFNAFEEKQNAGSQFRDNEVVAKRICPLQI